MAFSKPFVVCLFAALGWHVHGDAPLSGTMGAVPEDMMNSAVGKKPTRLGKSEPYIKCELCKLATEQVWTQTESAFKKAPYGNLGELAIGDIIEAACDNDDDGGDWVTFFDIVQNETGAPLELKKQKYLGECRRECATLVHACKAIFDEHREDMTELLFKYYKQVKDEGDKDAKPAKKPLKLSIDKFESRVCKKMSKACPGKTVPGKFKHKDEMWIHADEEGHRMRKMQHMMNKKADEQGAQKVQFLDPMNPAAMFNQDDGEL